LQEIYLYLSIISDNANLCFHDFISFSPGKRITYLNSGYHTVNVILAALVGSVTIMPGFVAFLLAGILRNSGISYMIIASFTTTLMMVGTITFPVELTYFGRKLP
jgi:hypothetical protein